MSLLLFLLFASFVIAAPFKRRQAPSGVPEFVTKYAPLVHLSSQDAYYPSDISAQLQNTIPQSNFTAIDAVPNPLTLDHLDALNGLGGEDVYLTSREDVETNPFWLFGQTPSSTGSTGDAITSTIIVNDHGDGVVDAFYFYFWAYNYGGEYFDFNIGNHVGDWEHDMIRFRDGLPEAVWFSQHAEGQAFEFGVLEKDGIRPVAYAANGSHAIYAISGLHDHTIPNLDLPFGPLTDTTDAGPLWDPTLSAYYYAYDPSTETFTAFDGQSPTGWLYFEGRWGDERYTESDPRQELVLGIDELAKYGSGPTGLRDKGLVRKDICPDDETVCIVRKVLVP